MCRYAGIEYRLRRAERSGDRSLRGLRTAILPLRKDEAPHPRVGHDAHIVPLRTKVRGVFSCAAARQIQIPPAAGGWIRGSIPTRAACRDYAAKRRRSAAPRGHRDLAVAETEAPHHRVGHDAHIVPLCSFKLYPQNNREEIAFAISSRGLLFFKYLLIHTS